MTQGASTFAAATPLPLGTTSNPTPLTGLTPSDASGYYSAWWSFTPSSGGYVMVDTLLTVGSVAYPDTELEVWVGSTQAAATLVGSNGDAGATLLSWLEIPVTAGTTYHVRAGAYDSSGAGIQSYVLRVGSLTSGTHAGPARNWDSTTEIQVGQSSASTPVSVMSVNPAGSSQHFADNHAMHRVAGWSLQRPSAATVVLDVSNSVGNLANLCLLVETGTLSSGGVNSPYTEIAYAEGGTSVTFNAEANRFYYIGVGVKADNGSVTEYVLSARSPVAGEWRDDSIPVWAVADESRTSNRVSAYYSSGRAEDDTPEAWAAATRAAWDGTGTVETLTTRDASHLDAEMAGGVTVAQWITVWVTVTRSGAKTISEGGLPPGIKDASGNFVDPNVVGVEWEPTSTAVGQQLMVTLGAAGFGLTPPDVPAGEPAFVKLGTYGGGVYAPGFLTAAALAGHQTLATVTPTVDGGEATAVITSLPGNPNDDLTVAVAIIDQATQTRTPPPYPVPPNPSWGRYTPLRASLQTAYAPRYRLLYATPPSSPPTTVAVRKVVRLFPRDGDGYGF